MTAEEQKTCPVTKPKLGSMGDPVAVEVDGPQDLGVLRGLPAQAQDQPAKYLARLAARATGEVLSVPESAVIDTGTRKVVYVESRARRLRGARGRSRPTHPATASPCLRASSPARRWRPPARS